LKHLLKKKSAKTPVVYCCCVFSCLSTAYVFTIRTTDVINCCFSILTIRIYCSASRALKVLLRWLVAASGDEVKTNGASWPSRLHSIVDYRTIFHTRRKTNSFGSRVCQKRSVGESERDSIWITYDARS